MSTEEEVAALRLMLREVAQTDATGIDYALVCQRERDEARREAEEAAAAYNAVAADLRRTAAERDELAAQAVDRLMLVASLRAERDAAQRELHRLSCGEAIESDGLCPEGIRADAARAWARLWHREARRLWREVQDLSEMLTSVRAGALREAADIARAHGGISAYYAIAKLAAEVEP